MPGTLNLKPHDPLTNSHMRLRDLFWRSFWMGLGFWVWGFKVQTLTLNPEP